LLALARDRGFDASAKPLPETDYCQIAFAGSNRQKVETVTEAFRVGGVNALVGTAALLGEGWDSPCLNTLVLANDVGAHMLSNQMRGRAIRADPEAPAKVANIWHLVAVEPPAAGQPEWWEVPPGHDFRTVARRFEGFFGPSYSSGVIASGIERVDTLVPPFDQAGIEGLNRDTLARAEDRPAVAAAWRQAADSAAATEVTSVLELPRRSPPTRFTFVDALNAVIVAGALVTVLRELANFAAAALFGQSWSGDRNVILAGLLALAAVVVLARLGPQVTRRCQALLSPRRTAQALADALVAAWSRLGPGGEGTGGGTGGEAGGEAGGGLGGGLGGAPADAAALATARAVIATSSRPDVLECYLVGGTLRHKREFAAAIAQMLGGLDNPRYLVVREGLTRPNPRTSFACPDSIATARAAAVFAEEITRRLDRHKVVYTRNPEGRALLHRCRRLARVNANARLLRPHLAVR
jgi:hypothetical protein